MIAIANSKPHIVVAHRLHTAVVPLCSYFIKCNAFIKHEN